MNVRRSMCIENDRRSEAFETAKYRPDTRMQQPWSGGTSMPGVRSPATPWGAILATSAARRIERSPRVDHQRVKIMTSPPSNHGRRAPGTAAGPSDIRPNIGGVTVREDDIEPVKGLRSIAILFRGMAIALLVLMVLQVIFAVTSTVPLSIGVVSAESMRLIIFSGLLWGGGDLAVLLVKSHYDLRATRILMARMAYMMRQMGEADGKLPPASAASREDRGA
jgi:hypothetical protein